MPANALYMRHPAGCCLHIVLDDGNVDTSSVEFCVNYATKEGHPDCLYLANLLLQMSRTQRLKLANSDRPDPYALVAEPKRSEVTAEKRSVCRVRVTSVTGDFPE